MPVVNKSTVTTIVGFSSFLNFFIAKDVSFIEPVIFITASSSTSIPLSLYISLINLTTISA